MLDPETDPLMRLAGAVADGDPVDWDGEHASATGDLRSRIRSLEVVDRVSGAHRSLRQDPRSGAAESDPSLATGDPAVLPHQHRPRLRVDE